MCTAQATLVVLAIGCRALLIGQVTKPIAPSQAAAFSLPVALALPKVASVEPNVLQLMPDVHQAGELSGGWSRAAVALGLAPSL
jgi:hypothetical protein